MIYGHNGTVHQTGHLDVEVHNGKVVSVWFRCMLLPFKQCEASIARDAEMEEAYNNTSKISIQAVDIKRFKTVYVVKKATDCKNFWYISPGADAREAWSIKREITEATKFTSLFLATAFMTQAGLGDGWRIEPYTFEEK